MASKQSEAVRDLWTSMAEAARATPSPPEDARGRVEHWGDLTAEPGGVDYAAIEVAGLPACWHLPTGEPEQAKTRACWQA